MRVSKQSLLATSWAACCTATVTGSTFSGPHTFGELQVALKDLGFEVVGAASAPESAIESSAKGSSSRCAATVSTI